MTLRRSTKNSRTLQAIYDQGVSDARRSAEEDLRQEYDEELLASQTAQDHLDALIDGDFVYEVCKRLAALAPIDLAYAAETGDEDAVIGDAMREAAKAIDGDRLCK